MKLVTKLLLSWRSPITNLNLHLHLHLNLHVQKIGQATNLSRDQQWTDLNPVPEDHKQITELLQLKLNQAMELLQPNPRQSMDPRRIPTDPHHLNLNRLNLNLNRLQIDRVILLLLLETVHRTELQLSIYLLENLAETIWAKLCKSSSAFSGVTSIRKKRRLTDIDVVNIRCENQSRCSSQSQMLNLYFSLCCISTGP